MTLGLAYWILMLVWFVFGFWVGGGLNASHFYLGSQLLLVILFTLLGWQVFGPPLKRG